MLCATVLSAIFPSYLYQYTDDNVEKRVGDTIYASVLVHEITYDNSGFYFADGTLLACYGRKENVRVKISLTASSINIGDVFAGTATVCSMDPEDPTDAYSLSRGYRYTLEFAHAYKTGTKTTLTVLSAKMQSFLCNSIEKYTDGQSAKLLSAMLLGEKAGLSPVFERDMQRLGLSHALALSGMHFTILLLGAQKLFSIFGMDKRWRYLLLALLTVFYLFCIGSSPAALRAGLMLLILTVCFFLKTEYDALTALALSVAVICTISPYTIQNISLLLSAFATLGILLAIGNDYGSREDKEKPKFPLLSAAFLSVKITLAASFATLPFLAAYFGTFPLLLIVSNLVFAPLMQLLLYAAVLVLLLGFVPPIAAGASLLCKLIIKLAALLSDIPRIQISLRHPVLLCILIVGAACLALLYLFPPPKKRKAKISAIILTFVLLSSSFFGIAKLLYRGETLTVDYQTTASQSGDVFILSERGCTAVIDSSRGSKRDLENTFDRLEKLYLTEIDCYVVTAYRSSFKSSLTKAMQEKTLHRIYLPIPESEEEEEIFVTLLLCAEESGSEVSLYQKNKLLSIGSIRFCLYQNTPLKSEKELAVFTLEKENFRFAYLSAEALTMNTWEELSNDFKNYGFILFGAFGSDKQNATIPSAPKFSSAEIYAVSAEHAPFQSEDGIVYGKKHRFYVK